jgi:hypothetical protein
VSNPTAARNPARRKTPVSSGAIVAPGSGPLFV